MITDITERKRAEEALLESEAKYHGLFDSMAEAFELMELVYENGKPVDYIFLDVNPAWERMTGLKKEQVLGRKASEAVGFVENYWPETMDRALRTGELVNIENYGSTRQVVQREYVEVFRDRLRSNNHRHYRAQEG
ncbi:hypothetical protein SDC9_167679 [bioreactor metagenome]|uniref:PAC domain-containing protein n=1 Tax=bioreactor metagenome TaxID=1076179 RepID=A0A645G0G1_9ZZZZ